MQSVDIPSRPRWVPTGIMMKRGERYRLRAAGQWKDLHILGGPEGYPSPNLLLKATEWLRRAPHQNWFTLIGGFDCDETSLFPIGGGCDLDVPRDGELCCFANDVWFTYWNNSGAVTLTVARLE